MEENLVVEIGSEGEEVDHHLILESVSIYQEMLIGVNIYDRALTAIEVE